MLFTVLTWAIVIRALISWFNLPPGNPVLRILNDITEPILAPLRRVVPRIAMIDFTPLVAILLMNFIQQALSIAIRSY